MTETKTFRPPVKANHYVANYWKSHSTNHSFKRPEDFDGWELNSLRTFDTELREDISTLKENKSQIVRDKQARGIPQKGYIHDIARIENRRRFLLRLRTGIESAIRSHPDRAAIKGEKRYIHFLQDACKELLSPAQCNAVMALAEKKNEAMKAKFC